MALVACKECGGEVSTEAVACPKCGAVVSKPPSTKWWLWIPLGLIGTFLLIGAISGNSPEGQEKSKARRAIEICWDEQKKKSLDPGAQRFIAGACEKMERDFEQRYGVRP